MTVGEAIELLENYDRNWEFCIDVDFFKDTVRYKRGNVEIRTIAPTFKDGNPSSYRVITARPDIRSRLAVYNPFEGRIPNG